MIPYSEMIMVLFTLLNKLQTDFSSQDEGEGEMEEFISLFYLEVNVTHHPKLYRRSELDLQLRRRSSD
ncbi:uncharacterized [Tachysurus ichikawai]